jgi:hypothetical protein
VPFSGCGADQYRWAVVRDAVVVRVIADAGGDVTRLGDPVAVAVTLVRDAVEVTIVGL